MTCFHGLRCLTYYFRKRLRNNPFPPRRPPTNVLARTPKLGEHTRLACEFGRRARTRGQPTRGQLQRGKSLWTQFSAGRRKPHARGVCSQKSTRGFVFNFGVRVKCSLRSL